MASVKKRPDGRWRARYRDAGGKEHAKHFDTKRAGEAWLATVKADMLRGVYVDPRAGKVTLKDFAQRWLDAQTFGESSRNAVALRLRVHIYPALGHYELRAIRPSTVQAWLRGLHRELAPAYVRTLLSHLSAIMGAAVEDELIVRNPCAAKSVKAPAGELTRIVPWTHEQVAAVVAAHPLEYRAVPIVAAGCGLRQGEVFGLSLDAVDFLRRRIVVRQQVKLMNGRPVLAPPKGGKVREVPLPDTVAVALSEHLRRRPARAVTLPWDTIEGPATTAQLVFTAPRGGALLHVGYNTNVWKKALASANVPATRANGMHALRHYYASVLLDAGESIRALADYLGHADPGFTLRIYTHLMPSSEERTRRAVDAVFGGWQNAATSHRADNSAC